MRKIIAGNWKMNKTREQATEFFKMLKEKTLRKNYDVIICPPFTAISIAREFADEFGFTIGAQNFCLGAKSGAMTGEISTEMLVELGVHHVIVGHSERRAHFGETDQTIAQKVTEAVKSGITPILCVGETLEQREKGEMKDVLRKQLISGYNVPKIVVAYEPVWAIGTGKTATVAQIAETHAFIKTIIGKDIPLLYGGSVNDSNAKEILALKDVDGVLIGGASLDPDKFCTIINS